MNHQKGVGLSEVLISLFLTSILITILSQFYLNNKRHYLEVENRLEFNFDVQWISNLLSDSIRRAGFTPCMGIDQLSTADSRSDVNSVSGVIIEAHPSQLIQINRMSEVFSEIRTINNSTQLIVTEGISFNEKHPVLIADCDHAEIHQIENIQKLEKGTLITLMKPLHFSYTSVAYIGEWLEEKWFIKLNLLGINTLHYKLVQTEELSSLVHSLRFKVQTIHEKKFINVIMGLDKNKTNEVLVGVRGS